MVTILIWIRYEIEGFSYDGNVSAAAQLAFYTWLFF